MKELLPSGFELIHSPCLEAMREMEDNSIDSVGCVAGLIGFYIWDLPMTQAWIAEIKAVYLP